MTWRHPAGAAWAAEPAPRVAKDGIALGHVARYAVAGMVLLRCPRCGGAFIARGALDPGPVTVTPDITCPCKRCQLVFRIATARLTVHSSGVEDVDLP